MAKRLETLAGFPTRRRKARGETYPAGVLVADGPNAYVLEGLRLREQHGRWLVNRVFDRWGDPLGTFATLAEAALAAARAQDEHYGRTP